MYKFCPRLSSPVLLHKFSNRRRRRKGLALPRLLYFPIFPHSRPQSLLGAWARGPGGSGDTGFEVLDFRTSGHFWFSTTFLIAFTCSCRSVNDCKFRWFKAFKRESSNFLLNRKWPALLKSRTSNPVSPGREWFSPPRNLVPGYCEIPWGAFVYAVVVAIKTNRIHRQEIE